MGEWGDILFSAETPSVRMSGIFMAPQSHFCLYGVTWALLISAVSLMWVMAMCALCGLEMGVGQGRAWSLVLAFLFILISPSHSCGPSLSARPSRMSTGPSRCLSRPGRSLSLSWRPGKTLQPCATCCGRDTLSSGCHSSSHREENRQLATTLCPAL